jgi:hypothetical protein
VRAWAHAPTDAGSAARVSSSAKRARG